MKSLCVFCGANSGEDPRYVEAATDLGKRLARAGITLVYGGGSVGLMGAVADACLDAEGTVIGVITEQLLGLEVGHQGCTDLIVVETMLERKEKMAELSEAFLSLPGGIGTMDELFEMVTWSQLDIHQKPSALLDIGGYYQYLAQFLERMASDGFVQRDHLKMLHIESDAQKAIEWLAAYKPAAVDKWGG